MNSTHNLNTPLLFPTLPTRKRAYKAVPAPHKPPAPQPLPAMPRGDRPRTADLCARRSPLPPLRARAHTHTDAHTHTLMHSLRTPQTKDIHTPYGQVRAANATSRGSRTPERRHHRHQGAQPAPPTALIPLGTRGAAARSPQPGAHSHPTRRSRRCLGARPYRARSAGRRSAR